jgi:pectate lyase
MRPIPLRSPALRQAVLPLGVILLLFGITGDSIGWPWHQDASTVTAVRADEYGPPADPGSNGNRGRRPSTTTAPDPARPPSTTAPTTTNAPATTEAVTSTTTEPPPTSAPIPTTPPNWVTVPPTSAPPTTAAPSTTAAPTAPTPTTIVAPTPAPPTAGDVTGAALVGVPDPQYGYAEWRGISGGRDRASYVVTSAADGGPGTYREALSHGDRYITFAPELDGRVIHLANPVTTEASNITIDASGRDITVSGFATKFSGTNIVIAGMTYRGMTGSENEDAITFRDAAQEQVFALYGNTFETATDGLVDVIWNRGHDVYGTICGNEFLHHDKAMLIHSGDQEHEGGRYHVTVCENRWVDVYQRAPFTRDSRIHQFNDVLERYGSPDGAGGGSKSGAESESSQHLLQNNIAIPRRAGETTWSGATVTKARTEFAGPQMGDGGAIRIDGSLLASNGDTTATQLENRRSEVAGQPYSAAPMPADAQTRSAVERHAGSCSPTPGSTINPCSPILTAPGGAVAVQVDGDAVSVTIRIDGQPVADAHHVSGGRWEAVVPVGTVGRMDAVVTDHRGATLETSATVVVAR